MQQSKRYKLNIHNRSGKDRRTKSDFNIRSLLFGGKREKIRRQEDSKRIFCVDHYSPELFFAIVSILLLCVIDALLTLTLLDRGAQEANPVMAYFLKFGPYTFFACKYLLAIIPVIILLMFRNIVLRVIKISACSVLYFMAVFYMAVVGLELYFVSNTAYSLEIKLPSKVITDTKIVCQMDTPAHHPISDQINL